MRFELTDNLVRLHLEEGEPIDILTDLQKHFSYNDTEYRYKLLQKAREQEIGIDLSNIKQLKEMSYMASDLWYQNFLCYTINLIEEVKKPYYNYVKKQAFIPTQMSDGYNVVLRVDMIKRTTVIPPGLFKMAIEFLQDVVEEDYGLVWELKVEDKRQGRIYLTDEPVYEYGGISLYPEQRKAVDKIRQTLADYDNFGYLFSRIMLDLSVNFGKTYSLYILCKNFTLQDGSPAPVIWFYSDRELLAKAVADYFPLEPNLSVIAADKKYVRDYLKAKEVQGFPVFDKQANFTLAMEQTIYSRLKAGKLNARYLKFWPVGMYDECHKGGSERAAKVISRFRFGALVGASGSPTSSLSGKSRYGVVGQFGAIRHKVEFKDTVEMGKSLPLKVLAMLNQIATKYPTNEFNVGSVKKFGIYNSKQRFQLLCHALSESVNAGRQTLIYGGSLHLKHLKNWHEQLLGQGFELDYTHGDDPGRIDKISRFSKRESEVIMSNRIMGTGIDISSIGSMIYLNPTDNEIDVLQAGIGRTGRLFKGVGKSFYEGLIWEFYDDDSFIDMNTFDLFTEDTDLTTNDDVIPGELTRISDIRLMYYREQNIPIEHINPLDL